MGAFWHLGNCIYQMALGKKGEKWINIQQHARSFFIDICLNPAVAFYAFTKILNSKESVFLQPFTTCIMVGSMMVMIYETLVLLLAGFSYDVFESFMGESVTRTMCLKQMMGLVGENGWPLTYDNKLDDIDVQPTQSSKIFKLKGFFMDYQLLQATLVLDKIREIIQSHKLRLKKAETTTFSNDPKEFLGYLEEKIKNKEFTNAKLKISSQTLRKYFEDLDLVNHVIRRFIPQKISLSFPYSVEVCAQSFIYPYPQDKEFQLLLQDFNNLLETFQKEQLSEDGPNEAFCKIKERVFKSENHYEVLGIEPNAFQELYKKEYLDSVKQIHPDKNPQEWRDEAGKLFKVVDAAYKLLCTQNECESK